MQRNSWLLLLPVVHFLPVGMHSLLQGVFIFQSLSNLNCFTKVDPQSHPLFLEGEERISHPTSRLDMKLRFRVPGASAPKEIVFEEGTAFGMLPFMLEEDLNVPAPFIAILSGVPPKPVQAEPDVPLEKLFKEGEMLVVSKRAGQTEEKIIRGVTNGRYVPPSDKHGVFIVRTVPSDNSCLFHACSYVLEDKNRTGGPSLRLRVAEAVQLNPEKFTEAYLGMPNRQYVEWIRNPHNWGGAIELDILSFLFQTTIHALDLQSSARRSFGEGQDYTTEAYVVYTGTHYDAMAMTHPVGGVVTGSGGPESEDQVLFNPRDEKVARSAKDFIEEARRKKRQGSS